MKYARLGTCTTNDPDFCFVKVNHPSALWLSSGDPIEDRYPADPYDVSIELDPDFMGVRLPDLIGNTRGLLILSAKARAVFAAAGLDLGPCDVCPFTLVNHKGRVHSKDYAFVSPLGGHDIAHPASDFERYTRSQQIYGCKRWVLDTNKLVGRPDLLRAEQLREHYFVSERLVGVVRAEGLTNFELFDVAHAAGPQ
jgi:hypothetical protein